MSGVVLKWTVPADDEWHPIGDGQVALVDIQGRQYGGSGVMGVVTVWTVEPTMAPTTRAVRVFGTGQPVPPDVEHIGSCQDGPLVWHLFRTTAPASSAAGGADGGADGDAGRG